MTIYQGIVSVIVFFVAGLDFASAYEVGHTPGTFSVGKRGEAIYEIPIIVPPGAGGLQPDLALAYNSHAGNGPLGVGWSISGLSAITRCPATLAQDGTAGAVRYDSSDKFCLDGRRLMKISGTYGENDSRYRTEIESFQDIEAYDDNADGHVDRFLVRDKAGLSFYYGYTESSRIEAQGQSYAHAWMLDRVVDKFGNYFAVDYAELSGTGQRGEFWVTDIFYRNSNDQNLGRVEFHYEFNRADMTYGFGYGGSMFSAVARLHQIDVYGHDQANGWSRARQYRLTYEYNSSNGHSQLQEVQQCDATGDRCLPPTLMSYLHGENGFAPGDFATLPSHYSNQFMDANGDGRIDQVYEHNWKWTIRLSGSHDQAHVTNIDSHPHARETEYTRVLDYNGDGKQDLLVANTATGHWEVLESTGTTFIRRDTGRLHWGAYQRHPLVIDLDGDALPEIVFKHNGWLKFYKNDGGVYSGPIDTGLSVSYAQVLTPLEYNGDGRPDIVVNTDGCAGNGGPPGPDPPVQPRYQPEKDSSYIRGTADCWQTAGILTWSTVDNNLMQLPMSGRTNTARIGGENNHNQLLDFNGDGLTDLAVAPASDSGQWLFYVNEGANWQLSWSGHHGINRDKVTVFDYDGDGRQELWQPSNGSWYRLRPNVAETWISFSAIPSGAFSGHRGIFMDWSGDGLGDLVISHGSYYSIRTHKGTKRGLLKSVENGLGDETQIAYVAMSDIVASVVYAGDTDTPVFPDRHFRAPMYLVRTVAADNGLLSTTGSDLKVTTNYTYYGAKLNQHGRGFLGFSRIEAHNVNTQIVTHNTHSQIFPFIGMVTRAEQWTPDVVVQAIDWVDIEEEFEPCQPATGPCTQPRSTADQSRSGKGTGSVTQQRNTVVPGEKLSETINTPASRLFDAGTAGQRYFRYIADSTERQFKYHTTDVIRRTVTTSFYDDFGNPTSMIVTVDDGSDGDIHRISTINEYQNWSDDRWCLGRLMRTTVLHERPDHGSGGPLGNTRKSSFEYDSSTCQLVRESIEPDSTEWRLQKDYGHDIFGNRISVSVSGPGIATRTTMTSYDEFGQFPLTQSNPLGHQLRTSWDYVFGHELTATDVNGFVGTIDYDTLGRKIRENAPRSTLWTEFASEWCGGSGCEARTAVFKTITRASSITAADQIQGIVERDQLGREVLSKTRAFDGSYIYRETHYDSAGRAYAISTPHFANEAACWAVSEYDNVGRIIAEYKPVEAQDCINFGPGVPDPASYTEIALAYGNVTSYSHDGLETSVTDAQGRVVTRVVNVMDRLVGLSERDDDDRQLETRYDYDPLGNMAWVRDANGNISRMGYNLRGFKISMDDPDLGHWQYRYNTVGELIWQQDAKSQITTMQYDPIGRMTSRTVAEGVTNWYFDSPGPGDDDPDYYGATTGRITKVTGPDGYIQLTRYTGPYGELTQTAERLDDIWHYLDFHYDAHGRIDSTLAPAVGDNDTEAQTRRLQLVTTFNPYGYPYLVREYRDQAYRQPLWRATEMDAQGHVTKEQTHDDTVTTTRHYDRATGALLSTTAGANGLIQNEGYQWDSVGNLTARSDYNNGWTERFFYDNFYRLSQVRLATTINGLGDVTATNQYDGIGNILCKDAPGLNRESCSGGYRSYVYGSGNTHSAGDAGPHAVTRISTDAGDRHYRYDNNGNLVSITGGGAWRETDWYSFNKPKRIWRKDNSAEFRYRPDDRSLWKQIQVKEGETTTTYYFGGNYERRVRAGQPDEHFYYVRAAGRVVGQIKRYGDTVNINTEQYFHRDQLGSVVAISNSSGVVIELMSYDAWGKRRHAGDWTSSGTHSFLYALQSQRGFTGHEHIDNMGLVNMNGRVYDFEIGRFLSADAFVQYPDSTQGLNRYSYVQNNPLSYTDPSGFFIEGLKAKIAGMIVTAITGQKWLGYLVQGYLSSGGDPKAMALMFLLNNPYLQIAYSTHQTLHTGIQAKESGDRFINGTLRAMKQRITGQLENIGQDYVIDIGTRITTSIRTAAASGTGAVGGGDKRATNANGAESGSFQYATKVKFEAELGVRIKGWLEMGANQDGQFFVNARGKTVSISLDETGNLTFSAGGLSTQVQIMRGEFEQLEKNVHNTFSIDFAMLGGSISALDTGDIQWRAHLKTPGLLGKLGIRGKAGLTGTFEPSAIIRGTYIGQAGLLYRRGTTKHVDRCIEANFDLEGC